MKNASIGWISLALLLVLAAGCGSGSGNLAEGLTPNHPAVVGQTPATGATNVLSNAAVTAAFDRAMIGSTVGFTLVKKGLLIDDPVPSTVSTTDNVTFTLTPNSLPLQTNTAYAASIAKGAKDSTGNTLPETVSWTFTTELAPAVAGTVPAENAQNVPSNTNVSVTFSRAMSDTTVSAVVVMGANINSGTPVPVVSRSFSSDNTVLTMVPQSNLTAGKVFTVKVFGTSKDMRGNPVGADKIWSFTTEGPPAVAVTAPPDRATNVLTDAKITVTFNRTIRSLFSAEVTLGSNPPLPFNWTPNGDNTVWTFTPPGGKLTANGSYAVRIISAADARGNTMQAEFTWGFQTESAPTVTSANPPLDGSGVLPYPIDNAFKVTVVFSKAMDPATLDNAIHLTRSGGTDVPGTVAVISATSATFTPQSPPLAAGATYNAVVTQAAKDPRGNPLGAPAEWTFRTESAPVPAPLKVVPPTYPDNNATGVSIRTPVVVNFDASLDPSTVTEASFQVTNVTDGVNVAGQIRKFDKAVIFYPIARLNPFGAKLYRITIADSVRSGLGGALQGGYSSNFTTRPSDVLSKEGAAGGSHAAIVLDNGSLYVWGKNSDGQVGDNTLINRNTPVRIATDNNGNPLPLMDNIALGKAHSLALDQSGGVWAWGNNTFGQVGDGTETVRPAPVKVTFPPGVRIVQLAAGDFHSLAVDDLGDVYAWGSNTDGQIGNGRLGVNQLSPVHVSLLSAVIKKVTAGSRHSVALVDSGAAWAWGSNDFGQLGDGTTITKREPVPVVSGASVDIRAGAFHTLFLNSTSTPSATGSDSDGQLGLGSSGGFKMTPQAITVLNPVNSISAGSFQSYAVMRNGTAMGWGRNGSGALCNGSITNSISPGDILNFAGSGVLTNIIRPLGGDGFTLLLGGDGTVWSCGANDFGQLGNGVDAPNALLPVPVFGF